MMPRETHVAAHEEPSYEESQGRLVTFPNLPESRRDLVELLDPTKSGHFRRMALMLIDPN